MDADSDDMTFAVNHSLASLSSLQESSKEVKLTVTLHQHCVKSRLQHTIGCGQGSHENLALAAEEPEESTTFLSLRTIAAEASKVHQQGIVSTAL